MVAGSKKTYSRRAARRRLVERHEVDVHRRGRLRDRRRGDGAADERRRGRAVGQHVHRRRLRRVERREVVVGDAVRREQRLTKYSKPAPAGPTTTRGPFRSRASVTPELARVRKSVTFGASVMTERTG
jgi:hypothetical protein